MLEEATPTQGHNAASGVTGGEDGVGGVRSSRRKERVYKQRSNRHVCPSEGLSVRLGQRVRDGHDKERRSF